MADQRIQYNEKMVGAGHGSLSDTLNRLALVEHNTDGTHKDSLIVQIVGSSTGAVASNAANIPEDDTIPQNTEGYEYMSLAITPTNVNNILIIEVQSFFGDSDGGAMIMALFQDSIADALAVAAYYSSATNSVNPLYIQHKMAAGTISPITFKMRAGASSGTTTFNGNAGLRKFGGKLNSFMRITEITP